MSENVYHRYLDIPVLPDIDLFAKTDYDPTQICHIIIDSDKINPKLNEWLATFDVSYYFIEAFYTPPNGGKIHIHTDTETVCDVVKINWTYGASGSKTIWWHPKQENKIEKKQTGFEAWYLTTEEQYCTKLYEAETNKPSLVNVGLFHSTFNPTAEKRWTLSLPLTDITTGERISWSDATDRFKDIIKREE